ncbi:30S ribosomal protein S21 [Vaginella massiliensis]|uniref:30S ribosomal protein S21 n=1 Tax=Vaginella massiliensis TaxID=1816680 RepID=UPI000837D58B|nr:30S ribosomal protein S21 [Vaginella massiliensis]
MLIIPVKDGESIERALKKYKRKYDRTGVLRQLRARQQYTKPSVLKRQKMGRAIYKQALLAQEEA